MVRRPDTFGDTIRPGVGRSVNAKPSGTNLVTTSSGGFVKTGSGSYVTSSPNKKSGNKSAAQGYSNKRKNKSKKSGRRKVPQIIDARNCTNRSSSIGIKGDNIITLKEMFSVDYDSKENTTEAYLQRLRERDSNSGFSTNRVSSPASFERGGTRSDSSGVQRLDSPILRGTGFGSSGAGVGGAGGSGGGGGSVSSSSGTIGLPTPDNLQENMNIGYESKHKGAGGAIQDAIMNATATTLRALGEKQAPDIEGGMSQMKALFNQAKGFYEQPGNLNNLIGAVGNMAGVQGFNTAFNNSMVQQFSGVMPRTFNFRWKLYADSESGTQSIFQVIQLLKEHSHPELIDPFLNIIRYPSILTRFDIRSPNGLIIFPIFESVITDITVDYSASGSPFFFKSGAPTSVALSLTIMEITSRVRGDYQASRSGFA